MTTDAEEPGRARARWDFHEVNVPVVVVLIAITAVLTVVGWWYRPGSTAYPTVSRRLAFTVVADARSLVMTLRRVGTDGAVLTLYDDDRFYAGAAAHGVTPGGWRIGIDGLGTGKVVRRPQPQPRGSGVPIPPGHAGLDHEFAPIPRVTGGRTPVLPDVGHVARLTYHPVSADAPLYLQIRWDSKAPVRLDGAYLTAQLPGVSVVWSGAAPASVPLATTLAPGAGDVGRFALQATVGPTVTAARSWTWQLDQTPAQATPYEAKNVAFTPIAFSAVNVSETQRESVRVFLSGVLLGIAGGAVLGVVLELVKIRRIRGDAGQR
jgi:hypothetical protein